MTATEGSEKTAHRCHSN